MTAENHFPSFESLEAWAGSLIRIIVNKNKRGKPVSCTYEVKKDKMFYYFEALKSKSGFDLIATSYRDIFAEEKNDKPD